MRQTKFMPAGHAVEFDLIYPKVREDDGGFSIFFISITELIHCEGGGKWHWAVSALVGLQKLSHWSLTCCTGAAEQQPHFLPGGMLSVRVTANRPEGGLSQARLIGMATAMASAHVTVSSLEWGPYFIQLCVSVPDEA